MEAYQDHNTNWRYHTTGPPGILTPSASEQNSQRANVFIPEYGEIWQVSRMNSTIRIYICSYTFNLALNILILSKADIVIDIHRAAEYPDNLRPISCEN